MWKCVGEWSINHFCFKNVYLCFWSLVSIQGQTQAFMVQGAYKMYSVSPSFSLGYLIFLFSYCCFFYTFFLIRKRIHRCLFLAVSDDYFDISIFDKKLGLTKYIKHYQKSVRCKPKKIFCLYDFQSNYLLRLLLLHVNYIQLQSKSNNFHETRGL